jgi:hypothetical protein
MLVIFWKAGYLDHPLLIAGWCVVGIGLQVAGDFGSPVWLVGLLMNIGAALYMFVRFKFG